MARLRQAGRARRAPPRRRRSAPEARRLILGIAEAHLAERGVEAVRLNAIARELGVTHQAILRHFGAREQLVEALLRHAGRRLRAELQAAAGDAPARERVRALHAALDRVYRRRGYARLSARLTLAGWRPRGAGMLRAAAETLHAQRVERARAGGHPPPALDDTLFAVALLNLATWGDALAGEATRRAVALPGDQATADRFRAWLVTLLQQRLFPAGATAARGARAARPVRRRGG